MPSSCFCEIYEKASESSECCVRSFVRSAGIPMWIIVLTLSCVSLAIVSIALMIPDSYVPAWTTSPSSHIEFNDNVVYRMQPRLATHAGVIHHDFITPK